MNKVTIESILLKEGVIYYPTTGNSMKPLIKPNKDITIIKKIDKPIKKYDVILFKKNNKYILHRVLKIKGNNYITCGDNMYNKEQCNKDDILGYLDKIIKNNKEISINDISYKIHTHIWCDFFYVRVFIIKIKDFFYKIKGDKNEYKRM